MKVSRTDRPKFPESSFQRSKRWILIELWSFGFDGFSANGGAFSSQWFHVILLIVSMIPWEAKVRCNRWQHAIALSPTRAAYYRRRQLGLSRYIIVLIRNSSDERRRAGERVVVGLSGLQPAQPAWPRPPIRLSAMARAAWTGCFLQTRPESSRVPSVLSISMLSINSSHRGCAHCLMFCLCLNVTSNDSIKCINTTSNLVLELFISFFFLYLDSVFHNWVETKLPY